MQYVADLRSGVDAPPETRIITMPVLSLIFGVAAFMATARSIHYLLFHTLAELIAIAVSFSIFTLAWASRQHLKNGYLIVLGAAYVTIGTVDVFHALTFKGMNLLPEGTTNHPTQFWLIARFIEAVALMVAPLFVQRQPGFTKTAWMFGLPGLLACLAVLKDWLPDTHIEGAGLTTFKVVSEYVIIAILLVGMGLLWQRRAAFPRQVFRLLAASLALAIATEVCFIQYIGFYDFSNELGHYFRFLSVVLAYLALVVTGVRQPADLLYRQLVEQDTALEKVNRQLHFSEDNLIKAQAVAGVGSWYLDIPNNQLTWSLETYRMFGMAPGTLQTVESFTAAVHSDDRQSVLAAWNDTLHHGKPYDIEHRIVVGGEIRWVRERAELTRSETGEPLAGVGTVQDVTASKMVLDRLVASEATLRDAQRIAQIGSWTYDLSSRRIDWSDEIFHILELSPQTPPAGDAFLQAVHPDDRERVKSAHRYFKTYHHAYELTFQLLPPDGMVKYVRQHARATTGSDGSVQRYVGTLQDITIQVLQEMAFKESEERFRTIADYTYDWEYWRGPQGEMLYISPSCERITGYTPGEFIARPTLFSDIVHPDDRPLMEEHQHHLTDQPHAALTYRIITKRGETRWIAHGCQAVFGPDGAPRGRRGSNRDITDLKQAEQLAQQLAYYDTLTQLPNRRMLIDRLLQALSQAKRFERALAVMFLDLDRFKQVNDSLGHDAGDALLIEIARRLASCVREGDTVARTGGDEFIIVLPEIARPEDATTVADKILDAVSRPVTLSGQDVQVSTSIGIAVYPVNGTDDTNELMKKADQAMYAAKGAGRNCYRLVSADF